MTKIEIYTTKNCLYCDKAKRLLKEKGAPFQEIRIDLDDHKRSEMLERSSGHTSVPQIFINDQYIGGCDDLFDLHSNGKLDTLLKK